MSDSTLSSSDQLSSPDQFSAIASDTRADSRANISSEIGSEAPMLAVKHQIAKGGQLLFLNLAHFLDHFFMLIFSTVAAFRLSQEWGMSYAELVPYATPGFITFGVCSLAAGWLADKWGREKMMLIFFLGIGFSGIAAGFTISPLQIALALTLVGIFASIYHPVGIAMLVQGRSKPGMVLAINGVYGNLGVACAALITGVLIDYLGWRSAFILPGIIALLLGVAYGTLLYRSQRSDVGQEREQGCGQASDQPVKESLVIQAVDKERVNQKVVDEKRADEKPADKKQVSVKKENQEIDQHQPGGLSKQTLIQAFAVIFTTCAMGSVLFQSSTFALPKIFDERLTDLVASETSATSVGWYAFAVFSLAALAQLLVGYLVDRYSARKVFMGVALLQALSFTLLTQATGLEALLWCALAMFAVFGQIPINDVLISRISQSEWRSRIYAVKNTLAFSVMAITLPLIGWIHGQWGFQLLFTLLAGTAFISVLALIFMPKAVAHSH